MGKMQFLRDIGILPEVDNSDGIDHTPDPINNSPIRGMNKEYSNLLEMELQQTKEALMKITELLKIYTCPQCGTIGWGVEIKELPQSEFDVKTGKSQRPLIDFSGLIPQKVVRFKGCPNPECNHIEEVK